MSFLNRSVFALPRVSEHFWLLLFHFELIKNLLAFSPDSHEVQSPFSVSAPDLQSRGAHVRDKHRDDVQQVEAEATKHQQLRLSQ